MNSGLKLNSSVKSIPTAYVYRRALRRAAISVVYTILNIAVCGFMTRWVLRGNVSPLILVAIFPLGLTLWNMWRCTAMDLARVEDKFKLAEAVLKDDWSCASEIMRRIGDGGSINSLEYRDWPSLKRFRKQPEFRGPLPTIAWRRISDNSGGRIAATRSPSKQGTARNEQHD